MAQTSLEYLLSTFFHQDLYEVYGDEEGAVDAFIARNPHRLPSLQTEIHEVLEANPTEECLAEYVDSTGCEFRPDAAGGGYRGWLTSIAERVRTATATE
jgi:hypothetical protein